jgi:hypothetical protein
MKLPSPIASLLALAVTALLYPLLVIVAHQWRLHERDALTPYRCDAGNEGDDEVIPLDASPLLEEYPIPPCFERWWQDEAKKGK